MTNQQQALLDMPIWLVIVLALVGGGIGARIAKEGREPFVNSVAKKVQPYWRALVQKVSYR